MSTLQPLPLFSVTFGNRQLFAVMRSLLLAALFLVCVSALRRCASHKRFTRFYKAKSCHKSTLSLVSFKTVDNVADCTSFARDKNGLAFNFSPQTLKTGRNCQVLGCPETNSSTTLVFDPLFDYYTAFADFISIENATCVKTLGLFVLGATKMNYLDAVGYCQALGGDLADVLGETHTSVLATLLMSFQNIESYQSAYVGLDDIENEGVFISATGDLLECSNYRAWAVGHPRPNRKKEDCVILDTDRTWRAINCKIKQRFLCQFYSAPPLYTQTEYEFKNCSLITSYRSKRRCQDNNKLYSLYYNSSRLDQCALLNALE